MPKTPEPSRLVNTSIRVPADLRAKYEKAVKAQNPEFDVSKGVRMHMREFVAAHEARENGHAA